MSALDARHEAERMAEEAIERMEREGFRPTDTTFEDRCRSRGRLRLGLIDAFEDLIRGGGRHGNA